MQQAAQRLSLADESPHVGGIAAVARDKHGSCTQLGQSRLEPLALASDASAARSEQHAFGAFACEQRGRSKAEAAQAARDHIRAWRETGRCSGRVLRAHP